MTNRATITLENDIKSRGVYLHRNGDKGSIAAFTLEVAKRLVSYGVVLCEHDSDAQREDAHLLFYALYFGAVREYLGYQGRNKDRSAFGVEMQGKGVRGMKDGHGCYKINDRFGCKRINISDFTVEETRNYNLITAFFEKAHEALGIVNGGEPMTWLLDAEAKPHIQSKLATAEVLKLNIEARIELLQKSLASLD